MKIQAFALSAALAITFTSCEQKPAASAAPVAPAAPAAPAPAPAPAPVAAPVAEVPPAPAVDPKEAFSKTLGTLADEVNALEAELKQSNPMEMMKKLPALMKKLEGVSIAGLPEDLAAAFTLVQKNSSATADVIALFPADLPSDPSKMEEYMKANPDALKTMMEIQTRMGPLKEQSDAASKELEAAAAKHGLDLTKFIKAGREMGEN